MISDEKTSLTVGVMQEALLAISCKNSLDDPRKLAENALQRVYEILSTKESPPAEKPRTIDIHAFNGA